VLDPRGLNVIGEFRLVGDQLYDVAKFAHSVVGFYDHIMAGLFTVSVVGTLDFTLDIHTDVTTRQIADFFRSEVALLGVSWTEICPIVVLLFLSMLPLHADSEYRQQGILANALRLYAEWREAIK